MAKTLSIVALGDVSRNLLETVAAGARNAFELEVRIDNPLADPGYAFNPGRSQYHAASILRKLGQSHLPPGRDYVLAIGPLDLFDPETEFVYGDGDSHLRSAALGMVRLRTADDERLARRVTAVSLWAAGLAMGLRDCDDSRCAMCVPRIVEELERRSGSLCPACKGLWAEGIES